VRDRLLDRLRSRWAEDRHLLFDTPDTSLRRVDYDAYWNARGGIRDELSIWQRFRVDYVAPRLSPSDVVLDLGCGGAGTLKALAARVPITGIGADVSEDALDSVRRAGFQALKLNLNDPAQIASCPEVDYVLAFELLEHLAEPEALLTALAPRVRKGFWISFPNSGYWIYRLRFAVAGRMPMQWIQHPAEHLRFWTLRDLRWWTSLIERDLAFQMQDLLVYRGYSNLARLFPGLFGMAFLFCLRRKDG
jgi:methionine biosynthesis protein MetW